MSGKRYGLAFLFFSNRETHDLSNYLYKEPFHLPIEIFHNIRVTGAITGTIRVCPRVGIGSVGVFRLFVFNSSTRAVITTNIFFGG